MADTKISALPVGAAIAGTELLVAVQSGADVQTTPADLLTYVNANASLDAARITAGTLAVARGGTNIGSYAVGDLLYASGATTLAKLAGVATGNALISGGVATAPSWGKIDLTAHVTGILPSANGGTGVNNAGTITNASNTTILNGGTLDLGGFTGTLPATGTFALLATANIFTALQTTKLTDAVTNASTRVGVFNHASSGTPATFFGTDIGFLASSNTTADRELGSIRYVWATVTDASRKARFLLYAADNGSATREVLRGEASGTGPLIGFLGANAAARQTSGADLTNNVTAGGTNDQIDNFTDLTTYATDAATIRNDIYQLARKLKQVNDALRLYGLLT